MLLPSNFLYTTLYNKNILSNGNLGENSPNSGNSSDEWRTGYIQGNTFSNKEVKYRIINGMAIFESDIILARTPKEIEGLAINLLRVSE